MTADADVRSVRGPDGREGTDGYEPAASDGDGNPAAAAVAPNEEVVVQFALDADALEHVDPDEPLNADAARELAAVLDSYAAAQERR